ncbi:MAG: hypothetical protein ABIA08_02625 [bacterium]
MKMSNINKYKLLILVFLFVLIPFTIKATVLDFNVDPNYDYQGRSEITAFLYQIGQNAYFFVEDNYYDGLSTESKKIFSDSIKSLSEEFDNVIYPRLTSLYGFEWRPGIDRDDRITILLSKIKTNSGGYFYSGDEYPRAQVPSSNEREILYFNADYISDPLAKSYLAHEFMHLINFNQKEIIYGVTEDIWLNEGRSEIAPTILGYDNIYTGSALQKRVSTFVQNSTDPLTEWKSAISDYGVLNIFMQYFIDHYGAKILSDSLRSNKVGIPSLNEALKKNGYSDDFSQIFTDWTIAVLINDCSVGQKYCFLNNNLKNLKVLPQLTYLPISGESTLTMTDYTKNWMGNWIKFIGGDGTLQVEFIGDDRVDFSVPYILRDQSGKYSVGFFDLSNSKRGNIYINNFGTAYDFLVIIPSIHTKLSGFSGIENYYKFIWLTSVVNESPDDNEELIQQLLVQIEYLKAEIAKIQAQIAAIIGQGGSCESLNSNLYFGMSNNNEVKCLQQFLKSQGTDIYPEGIVNGNFYSLTMQAVIRFQERYASEILAPLGLIQGSGFVGQSTRTKINKLLRD